MNREQSRFGVWGGWVLSLACGHDFGRFSFDARDAAPNQPETVPDDAGDRELDGGGRPSVLVARFDHYGFTRGAMQHSVSDAARGLLQNDDGDPRRVDLAMATVTTRYQGIVVLDEAGTFRYEPPEGAVFWGDDSFEYTLTDGRDVTRARVRLTVNPGSVSLSDLRRIGRGRVIPSSGGDVLAAALAGDVNGMGRADLVVTKAIPSRADATCVLFGESVLQPTVDPSDCTGAGFALTGGFEGQPSLAGAGDVDGDRLDDLLIGDVSSDLGGGDSGAVYVVFGKADAEEVNLDALAEGQSELGFVVRGAAAGQALGAAIAPCGDFNGDGWGDVVLGARNTGSAGAVYVILGAPRAAGDVLLAEPSERVIVIEGSEGDPTTGIARIGSTVAGAGDVNGDGLDDVVIGSPDSNLGGPRTGSVYVVFGKTDRAAVALRGFENQTAGGFVRYGPVEGAHAGSSVSGAGDFDGDGYADFAYGARGESAPTSIAPTASVVFGRDPWTGVIPPVSEGAVADDSLTVTGIPAAGGSIVLLTSAGDQNGDRVGDLLMALPADSDDRGVVVTVLGTKAERRDRSLLAILEGREQGAIFEGEGTGELAGSSISGGGDVDGDGLDDAIVSTGRAATNENDTYVLLGWDMKDALGDRDGSFVGGSGPDRYALGAPVVRIDGGHGIDTLEVRDRPFVDLTELPLRSIEQIDMSGGMPTLLRIDLATLCRLPQSRPALPGGVARLLEIFGDADDAIEWRGSAPAFDPLVDSIQKRRGAYFCGLRLTGDIAATTPRTVP